MTSPIEDSITVWIEQLKEGDGKSQQEIWDRYFHRLVRIAQGKIAAVRARDFDAEDVALSAFESFFRAAEMKRFPKLDDRSDLWKVLIVITARKAAKQRDRAAAAKRGGGILFGESVLGVNELVQDGINQVLGDEPTPEVAAEVAENYESLMNDLPDNTLRRLAQLKFEGYSNREIAAELDCVERTVERKLARIRGIWMKAV